MSMFHFAERNPLAVSTVASPRRTRSIELIPFAVCFANHGLRSARERIRCDIGEEASYRLMTNADTMVIKGCGSFIPLRPVRVTQSRSWT